MKLLSVCKVPLVLMLAMTANFVCAQEAEALKAAYVYNFSKFVSWTDAEPPGENIIVCVDTENERMRAQMGSIDGKPVANKKLSVQMIDLEGFSDSELSKTCQVLYSDREESSRGDDFYHGVLVVTDVIRPHATISFSVLNKKLSFQVDLARAREQGLKISSRLLRLAEKVKR